MRDGGAEGAQSRKIWTKWMCFVNQAQLHLYVSLHPCESAERLLCKQTALLLHVTSESPGLVEAYSPEAASESLGLRGWLKSRRIKRIMQLNFSQGNKKCQSGSWGWKQIPRQGLVVTIWTIPDEPVFGSIFKETQWTQSVNVTVAQVF